MIVKGRYNLVSHDQAELALYITTSTDIRVFRKTQRIRMQISKGRGDFELVHSHLFPGLPHVSMYADSRSFAALYFGTKAEALEESKASWITKASPASAKTGRLRFRQSKADCKRSCRRIQMILIAHGRFEAALQRHIRYHYSSVEYGKAGGASGFVIRAF